MVDLLDDDLLHAVGVMCPNLKHVIFNSKAKDHAKDDDFENDLFPFDFFDDDDDDSNPTENDSNLMIRSLNSWPKVSKT